MSQGQGIQQALDNAPLGLFHLRAVVISGTGFFTDAYDLFIIGAALDLIKAQWSPSKVMLGLLGSTALLAAFLGATVFGRLADRWGRKKIYGVEAIIMAAGALLSAFSPNIYWLLVFRFIMGLGIGGDYPVSAVLMSEYANVKDRGKLVALVFSMQALGLIAGPVVAMTLVASGIPLGLAWRIMLGLGAVPAMAVIMMRRRMPESPRYMAEVKGEQDQAAANWSRFSGIEVNHAEAEPKPLPAKPAVAGKKVWRLLAGTAGSWFLFDYAYYGNSISMPLVLKGIEPHSSALTQMAWSLIIFALFAAPGYIVAFSKIDQIGHRRLQMVGFVMMALCFFVIGIWRNIGAHVVAFLVIFGISYFFAEFGPNTTTFVIPAEVFPVSMRATGHGISAGMAKLGAFIGVFVFPLLSSALGVSGTLLITSLFSILGALVSLLLPEPKGRSLSELAGEVATRPLVPRPRH
ncbi:MFS transporter [Sulfobacillus harzensis]|uniref:MFS transporter n=1 Tax=Sulfobacillus harzensis TaxID=2729629 RepID=A0A7Y0Q4L0_9FIRM|nr:MFS transporter [Sulfobacillus harzensis]NMP24530.1 MFS transporter [Sulfobacillus harzensis]